jgi:hypothetical protein
MAPISPSVTHSGQISFTCSGVSTLTLTPMVSATPA